LRKAKYSVTLMSHKNDFVLPSSQFRLNTSFHVIADECFHSKLPFRHFITKPILVSNDNWSLVAINISVVLPVFLITESQLVGCSSFRNRQLVIDSNLVLQF
jgi:hypothetical protein